MQAWTRHELMSERYYPLLTAGEDAGVDAARLQCDGLPELLRDGDRAQVTLLTVTTMTIPDH